MGLETAGVTYTAAPFELWNGVAPPLIHYNDYLITPPRIYDMGWQEQPGGGPGSTGPLWASCYTWNQPAPNSPSTFTIAALIDWLYYPGGVTVRWDFDPSTGTLFNVVTGAVWPPPVLGPAANAQGYDSNGNLIPYAPMQLSSNVFSGASGANITQEPNLGGVWAYDVDLDVFQGGPIQFDPSTGLTIPGSVITETPYTGSPRGTHGTGIFGLDRVNNILMAGWNNPTGIVGIYNFTTGARVGSIALPNPYNNQIVSFFLDGKFAYACDNLRWIHIYDYSGRYYRSLLNDAIAPGTKAVYSYDTLYHCLRCVPITLCSSPTGASTLTPTAYYTVAESTQLTKPVPLKVPRLNRIVPLWSHLSGSGLEPVAGLPGVFSGPVSGQVTADVNGDLILPATMTATGSISPIVTVSP